MIPGRAGFGTSASAIERLDPSTAVPVRGRPWLRWTRDTRACRSAVRACRGSVCAAPGEGPRAVTHSLDSARAAVCVLHLGSLAVGNSYADVTEDSLCHANSKDEAFSRIDPSSFNHNAQDRKALIRMALPTRINEKCNEHEKTKPHAMAARLYRA